MKNQILLESDPFYISDRIKEIDKNYYFVFNTKENRIELHRANQKGSTFSLVIPYECLDERAIFLAKKTRIENLNKLIEEIDKENEMREIKLRKQAFEQIKEVIYDN